jgi:leucyl/phenylalanyl-tRNA--protein transferase
VPPIEPEPTRWLLYPAPDGGDDPDAEESDPDDLVSIGADLEPGTILRGYRLGLFPMGLGELGAPPIGWWSPVTRGVLLPGQLHLTRSLRQSARRYTTSTDRAFTDVVAGCAAPGRDGRWITPEIATAYARLHELGWAHSVEVWDRRGALVGGLYGLAIGGLFAGESMFHTARDASKVALVALVERWFADADPRRLIDVQWPTPHLRTLGVEEVARADYRRRLAAALDVASGWG